MALGAHTVVVLTDGEPTSGETGSGALCKLAHELGVPVSTVGVCLSSRGRSLLEKIATATGASSNFSDLKSTPDDGEASSISGMAAAAC